MTTNRTDITLAAINGRGPRIHSSAFIAPGEISVMGESFASLKRAMKCSASSAMSSLWSRSGGTMMWMTFRR